MPLHNDLTSILDFYIACTQLKHEIRQGWNKRGIPAEQCESIADHSFGVILLGYVLADQYFPQLDRTKILKLGLIHDLPELISKDITPLDGISPSDKRRAESNACVQLFKTLPHGDEYIALWMEYEDQSSLEARFVYQIDKLEMGIQAFVYESQGLGNLDAYFSDVERKLSDPVLKTLFEYVLQERAVQET